jgi:hypothetical protein
MKKLLLLSSILFLSGCSWSIIMNHTEGQASDVVDETQSPTTSVDVPVNYDSVFNEKLPIDKPVIKKDSQEIKKNEGNS